MKEVKVRYKCRMCGNTEVSTYHPLCSGKELLDSVAEESGEHISKVHLHDCVDGYVGICDLIGVNLWE